MVYGKDTRHCGTLSHNESTIDPFYESAPLSAGWIPLYGHTWLIIISCIWRQCIDINIELAFHRCTSPAKTSRATTSTSMRRRNSRRSTRTSTSQSRVFSCLIPSHKPETLTLHGIAHLTLGPDTGWIARDLIVVSQGDVAQS